MRTKEKTLEEILSKLGITELNAMQKDAHHTILAHKEIVLLSPTGTGKTLAFLLPILSKLDIEEENVQALILVPSRELAIQIEQVARDIGSGFKINAVYGGRSGSKDKIELKKPPAILIGTPGRVADHLRRQVFSTKSIKTLVLDEFDKSLETGFEKEMKQIVLALPQVEKKILTSATEGVEMPHFVGIENPQKLDYLDNTETRLELRTVIAKSKDKLEALEQLLRHLRKGRGIVFCNFKNTIQFVSDYLDEKNIRHTCFYGGLEQLERERALIKFRNGTHKILIATDLAARGLDVPEIDYIIHYQIPTQEDQFIHRNGRTARMHASGKAYILKWEDAPLPEFISDVEVEEISNAGNYKPSKWETLFISGGRRDKISKGDIAGLFFKQGKLNSDELGDIELKQECAFVAVPRAKVKALIQALDNTKLKKKKVRISVLK